MGHESTKQLENLRGHNSPSCRLGFQRVQQHQAVKVPKKAQQTAHSRRVGSQESQQQKAVRT
jgi:hypothetical protein